MSRWQTSDFIGAARPESDGSCGGSSSVRPDNSAFAVPGAVPGAQPSAGSECAPRQQPGAAVSASPSRSDGPRAPGPGEQGSPGCFERGKAGAADPVEAGRRWFLKTAAAFTTAVLAPGVTLMAFAESSPAAAKAPGASVDARRRWGLLIDASKCADGCTACVSACSSENGWAAPGRPATDAQWIRKLTVKNPRNGASFSLPMMCQHCAKPPCVDVCPTGASFKRADGIVLVDKHICIGCRYCMMACPYKARSFIHETLEDQKPHAPRGKGTVESCTMCVHRVDAGRTPACVEACAKAGHQAMLFGDLNDPASEIARRVATFRTTRIRADLGTDPGVHYQGI